MGWKILALSRFIPRAILKSRLLLNGEFFKEFQEEEELNEFLVDVITKQRQADVLAQDVLYMALVLRLVKTNIVIYVFMKTTPYWDGYFYFNHLQAIYAGSLIMST